MRSIALEECFCVVYDASGTREQRAPSSLFYGHFPPTPVNHRDSVMSYLRAGKLVDCQ